MSVCFEVVADAVAVIFVDVFFAFECGRMNPAVSDRSDLLGRVDLSGSR